MKFRVLPKKKLNIRLGDETVLDDGKIDSSSSISSNDEKEPSQGNVVNTLHYQIDSLPINIIILRM